MMVLPRFRYGFLLTSMLLVGLVLQGCGEEKEEVSETPAVTQPAGAETPDAQEVPGVTDSEILLGAHVPLSQTTAAVYAALADAMTAYFEYVNSQGGVHGRKITFLVGDDHFNPADAVDVVRKLVEQDGIFAMTGAVGPNSHLAVYRYLEEQGVPDLFIGGGLKEFLEPVGKSRFGGIPAYETEVIPIAEYVIDNYDGKRLGLLIQNDEAGVVGEAGLREILEGSDIQIVGRETCELTDTDLTPYAQRLKNANPDVVVMVVNAPLAANFIKVVRDVVAWDVPLVAGTAVAGEIVPALAGSENVEGMVAMTWSKMASQTDDPGIQRHTEIMQQFAPDVAVSTFTIYGQIFAELTVKALENAGPNLTRESLIEGAEAIRDFCCTLCVGPVNLGPDDHRPMEAVLQIRWQNGAWVPFDEPVSFESTPGKAIGCKGMGEPVYAGEGE
jgi:branched-chain amino acid transport system substrate-binding protein